MEKLHRTVLFFAIGLLLLTSCDISNSDIKNNTIEDTSLVQTRRVIDFSMQTNTNNNWPYTIIYDTISTTYIAKTRYTEYPFIKYNIDSIIQNSYIDFFIHASNYGDSIDIFINDSLISSKRYEENISRYLDRFRIKRSSENQIIKFVINGELDSYTVDVTGYNYMWIMKGTKEMIIIVSNNKPQKW